MNGLSYEGLKEEFQKNGIPYEVVYMESIDSTNTYAMREGVVDAVVDLKLKQVTVSGNASVDVLKKAITDAGYEVVE